MEISVNLFLNIFFIILNNKQTIAFFLSFKKFIFLNLNFEIKPSHFTLLQQF